MHSRNLWNVWNLIFNTDFFSVQQIGLKQLGEEEFDMDELEKELADINDQQLQGSFITWCSVL